MYNYSSEITFNIPELGLYHFGVPHGKGPTGRGSGRYPWGSGDRPQQRANKRTIKSYRRHVFASGRNVRLKDKVAMEDEENLEGAKKLYQKESSRPYLSFKKHAERVVAAKEVLDAALSTSEKSQADLARALKIYNQDRDLYISKLKEVGSTKLDSLKSINYPLANQQIMDLLKTDFMLIKLPVIRNLYGGRYSSRKEMELMDELMKRKASEQY